MWEKKKWKNIDRKCSSFSSPLTVYLGDEWRVTTYLFLPVLSWGVKWNSPSPPFFFIFPNERPPVFAQRERSLDRFECRYRTDLPKRAQERAGFKLEKRTPANAESKLRKMSPLPTLLSCFDAQIEAISINAISSGFREHSFVLAPPLLMKKH